MMGISAVFLVAVLTALISTSKREHPRQEAKEKAAGEAKAAGAPAPPKPKPGGAIKVAEAEYSVKPAASTLGAGSYTFTAANVGKIPHDLAIEGPAIEKEAKTPLIDPGKTASLKVDLKPGKYKLYCTVPGHEQLGMKTEVSVR
jgi:uncharacterized cupredoxin-like copper-binding protein